MKISNEIKFIIKLLSIYLLILLAGILSAKNTIDQVFDHLDPVKVVSSEMISNSILKQTKQV